MTVDKKAAVTLRIDDDRLHPLEAGRELQDRRPGPDRREVRGVRAGFELGARQLARIDRGDGEGERLLPVERTSSPVDLDLLNDIMRLPYRQRFAILLSEFGTGLAGRGEELNEVIHRANPALRETDEVLKILADQNRDAGAPGARLGPGAGAAGARARVASPTSSVQANETGEASAERARRPAPRSIQLLPGFLRELRPLMVGPRGLRRPGHAAAHRPERRRAGPRPPDRGAGHARRRLARVASPASATRSSVGRPALIEARPLIQDLGKLGHGGRPGREEPRRAHQEPRRDRRDRAPERLHLLRHAGRSTASTGSATTCAPAW